MNLNEKISYIATIIFLQFVLENTHFYLMSQLPQSWSEKHHKKLLIELEEIYGTNQNIDVTQYIEQIKIVEQFSLEQKRFFALFSQIDFYFLYISNNIVHALGYTPEEIYKKGLFFAFKRVIWKQVPMALKVNQWGKRFRKVMGNKVPSNIQQEIFYCGAKFKNKEGKVKTFFIKQKILTTRGTVPILSFMDVEDISSFYKADFMWGRFTAKHDNQFYCRAFFQNSTKKAYQDILSPRELEILHLIVAQKNSAEISEILEISKNTVERHRKNMIARLGVIDMTALIHICKLCKLI